MTPSILYTDIPGMHKYFAELSLKSSFLYTPTLPQRHTHSEGVVKDRSDIMLLASSVPIMVESRQKEVSKDLST